MNDVVDYKGFVIFHEKPPQTIMQNFFSTLSVDINDLILERTPEDEEGNFLFCGAGNESEIEKVIEEIRPFVSDGFIAYGNKEVMFG